MDALLRHTFVPDYSVRAVTDVLYLAIKRTLYLAAKRATLMERSQRIEELGSSEPIDEEVEKVNQQHTFLLYGRNLHYKHCDPLHVGCFVNICLIFQLLHSLDEDDRSITAHTANLNAITPRQSKPGSKASSPIDYLVRVRNSKWFL